MSQTEKISFFSLLALIFLLPVFFLPANIVPLGVAKTGLIALAAIVGFVALALTVLRNGGLEFPSSGLLWMVLAFPAVYLASALLSSTRDLSLFGYAMEPGTAVFMSLALALFGLVAVVFSDSAKIVRALSALFLSLALVSLFALVKILSGGSFPVWGTFFGNMGNPVGSWIDYAVVFGLLASLSTLALGVLPLARPMRMFMYLAFALSTFLLAVINFSSAFVVVFVLSLIMLVYMLTIEKRLTGGEGKARVWPTAVLCVVSLLFIVNPIVSATRGSLGDTLSGALGVSNLDVRPSFTTTLGISKSVFQDSPLLGGGPNTFSQNWLLYKPREVNSSVFWNASFPSGFGFIPTQASSVGILGSVAWAAFFILFLLLGLRALSHAPTDRWHRFLVLSTFLGALLLWLLSFFYTPSSVVLVLAFILTGLFVAACRSTGIVSGRSLSMSRNLVLNFASVLVIVVLSIGAVSLGFSAFQRTAAAYHYQRALVLSGTVGSAADEIDAELVKASRLVPADAYFTALSELNISRAQAALNSTEGAPEENLATFQNALARGITAAQAAVEANRSNYRNWVTLGTIYSSLVPEPFKVEGAYESAKTAFEEARKRNPNSPEVPMLLARLEFDKGNNAQARAYIQEAISFKQDYADAYFLLTQLEIRENNIAGAIRSAETTALLSPDNAGIFFQVGLLKYSNKDYQGAAAALAQALNILPEYANAKYFLGLSLSELGRKEDAVVIFEELVKSNPDNAEVALILENLKSGKPALEGIPREDRQIETRENPPITEQE